jgi:antitoxin component of MazEF toxin-antitoxin module
MVVKIRRVGNSNVVTLPREFERGGYAAGDSVVIEQLPTGELLLVPASRLREHIREIGRRNIEKHREALDMLEAHDRGSSPIHSVRE